MITICVSADFYFLIRLRLILVLHCIFVNAIFHSLIASCACRMSRSAESLRKYKFVKDIGEGSFGKAMLYEHKGDGQKVTINTNGFGFRKKAMLCIQFKLRIFGQ